MVIKIYRLRKLDIAATEIVTEDLPALKGVNIRNTIHQNRKQREGWGGGQCDGRHPGQHAVSFRRQEIIRWDAVQGEARPEGEKPYVFKRQTAPLQGT